MRVLVVGGGGREHAIAWKLAQSRHRPELIIAPGNAGTARLGRNVAVAANDIDGQVALARSERADLIFIGPDDPIAMGLADRLRAAGLRAFGPMAAAARIESSKWWAKQLMMKYGMPTAHAEFFDNPHQAEKYALSKPEGSTVIKADGLAAGKGVIVPDSHAGASAAIRSLMIENAVGGAGSKILVEDRLSGPEVSVFAFIYGEHVSAMISACDYKRAEDGDSGPNTGGMGAYTPAEFWTPELAATVRRDIMVPVARALAYEGCPFTGILYASVIVTDDGPKVIEFNARLGDPEAQVVVPALRDDLVDLCFDTIEGKPGFIRLKWDARPRVCVVMASGGYPEKYTTGFPVFGLSEAEKDALLFHAGTKSGPGGEVLTSGGRVLGVTTDGETMKEARDRAYRAVTKIAFEGARYRTDIAARAAGVGTLPAKPRSH